MDQPLLKPRDAAVLLGLGESTLAKLRLTGGGPEFIKLGRSVRYTRESLEKWASRHARSSTSDAGMSAS